VAAARPSSSVVQPAIARAGQGAINIIGCARIPASFRIRVAPPLVFLKRSGMRPPTGRDACRRSFVIDRTAKAISLWPRQTQLAAITAAEALTVVTVTSLPETVSVRATAEADMRRLLLDARSVSVMIESTPL
jgi:hypothetical protein